MPDSFDYTTGTNSENVRLLQALIDDAPEYTEETNSRNANILKSIINNTEYTDAPQSEIEELLLRLKAKIGGEIEVDELNVTENGTYDAGVNKAYNPVKVELPLNGKTITENGTYTASDDNLAGYDEVTVAVEGYAKKSIANTPTPIATFNASALPMPSLKVGIEAVQAGSGDPSPENVRPISGWTACNVVRTGKNLVYKTISKATISSNGESVIASYLNSDMQIAQVKKDKVYTITSDELFVGGFFTSEPTNGSVTYNNSRWADTPKTFTSPIDGYVAFRTSNGYATPQMEMGTQSTTYEEYNGDTYTTTLKDGQGNPLTCYGGELSNVNGVQSLELTHGYIASYNGETLPSTWISDRDVYAEGTTPTIGAEVVYELATPQTIPQDNLAIATQEGTNNLWADSGDVLEGSYFKSLN